MICENASNLRSWILCSNLLLIADGQCLSLIQSVRLANLAVCKFLDFSALRSVSFMVVKNSEGFFLAVPDRLASVYCVRPNFFSSSL